ncbi:hypothetical protein F5Y14DRAFT_390502 [Nemania sp. NC0429]|nr:hypothetical protein F5Y14DRAFT_390502 [Nemania sp. NC0429]
MNQEVEPWSHPINGLPAELLQMILEALPDVLSLHNAVLSCSLFYHTFSHVQSTVTTRVLLNQVNLDVLPEAIMAAESILLRPHDSDPTSYRTIMKFVVENLQKRPSPPRSWTLQKALRVSRLHSYVDVLTNNFIAATLTTHPLSRSDHHPVTYQETCRVKRALYRFEVYCNLFREESDVESPIYNEQKSLFFAHFAPYENEQLGCIHDYLVRAVSPVHNEVAEHDVGWGASNVSYEASPDSFHLQYILSLGIEKLCDIVNAETYEERYRVLDATNGPSSTVSFLYQGFETANNSNPDVWLEDLTPEIENLYIRRPYFNDPDPGPADAWRWAHLELSCVNWVYHGDRDQLRRWGYVMWDRSRLEEVGVFQGPWEDMVSPEDSLLERQELGRQRAYMENSWGPRERISRDGGSGWWAWGDESQIRWEKKREPPWGVVKRTCCSRELVKPKSLQEARCMLSTMTAPVSAGKY